MLLQESQELTSLSASSSCFARLFARPDLSHRDGDKNGHQHATTNNNNDDPSPPCSRPFLAHRLAPRLD